MGQTNHSGILLALHTAHLVAAYSRDGSTDEGLRLNLL
jgi:hypothetical protein